MVSTTCLYSGDSMIWKISDITIINCFCRSLYSKYWYGIVEKMTDILDINVINLFELSLRRLDPDPDPRIYKEEPWIELTGDFVAENRI